MGAAQTVGDPRFVEPVPYRMTTHERLVFALAMVVSLAGMAIAVLAFQHFDGLRERGLERDAWASLAIWTTLSSIMVFGALPLSLWPRIRRERARLAACPTVSGRIIELKVPERGEGSPSKRTAVVEFTVDGRVIHAADRYPDFTVRGRVVGDVVDVRYDPSDPGWVVVGEISRMRVQRLCVMVGLGYALTIFGPTAFLLFQAATTTNSAAMLGSWWILTRARGAQAPSIIVGNDGAGRQ